MVLPQLPGKQHEYHDGCDHYETATPPGLKPRIKDAQQVYCNGKKLRYLLVPVGKQFAIKVMWGYADQLPVMVTAKTAVAALKKFSKLSTAQRREIRLGLV